MDLSQKSLFLVILVVTLTHMSQNKVFEIEIGCEKYNFSLQPVHFADQISGI